MFRNGIPILGTLQEAEAAHTAPPAGRRAPEPPSPSAHCQESPRGPQVYSADPARTSTPLTLSDFTEPCKGTRSRCHYAHVIHEETDAIRVNVLPKPSRSVAKPGLSGVSPSEPSDHAAPSIYVPHRGPGRHALHVRQTNSKGLVLVPHLLWEEGQNPDLSEILQKWYHLGRPDTFLPDSSPRDVPSSHVSRACDRLSAAWPRHTGQTRRKTETFSLLTPVLP